jgi:hypothetical protein
MTSPSHFETMPLQHGIMPISFATMPSQYKVVPIPLAKKGNLIFKYQILMPITQKQFEFAIYVPPHVGPSTTITTINYSYCANVSMQKGQFGILQRNSLGYFFYLCFHNTNYGTHFCQ